jgi:tetratricopeptide (TPR) repeat protein
MKLKTFTMTVSLALFLLTMSQIALAQKSGEPYYVYFDANDRPTLKFTNKPGKNQRCGALASYSLLDNQEEAVAVRAHHLHYGTIFSSPSLPEYGWLYITSSRIVFIVINGDKSHSFDIPRTYLKDKPVGGIYAPYVGIQIKLKERLPVSDSAAQKFAFHLLTEDKHCDLRDWRPYLKFIDGAVKDFNGTMAEFKRVAAALKQSGEFQLLAEMPRRLSRAIPDPFSEFGESMIDNAVGEPNQAKSQFDPPNPDDPSGPRGVYHARLSMIDAQNGRTGQARTNAEKALQLLTSPSNDSEFYARGVAHHKLANYDLAIADFDNAIQLNPNRAETYFYRGKAYYDKGNYALAIADFDKAIQLDPKEASAYSYRGTTYLNKGDNKRAIADYSALILLKPDYRVGYQNRAIAYERLGDQQQANADWDKVEIEKQNAKP